MPFSSSDSADERKTRGDSNLDKLLNEGEQEVFFAYVERATLKDAATWLRVHHDLDLSATTIGKWAAKQRRKADDFRFACLLKEIRHDNEQATQLAGQIGDAAKLNEANVLLLSQALFQASRTGDPGELKAAAKLFSMVMESTAKAKAAEASVLAAETSRDRFQFDAAKLALEHAETLQSIKSSDGSEREKIERAVEAVFGRRPEHLALSTSGGGSNASVGSSAGKNYSDADVSGSGDTSSVKSAQADLKTGTTYTGPGTISGVKSKQTGGVN